MFQNGLSKHKISKLLSTPRTTVIDAINRYQETGSNQDKPGRGRKKTATTPESKRKVKARILHNPTSQVNSSRKIAKALGI
uniref:Paired domain-containing protein n=1 Tax=Acrobeloides nanus TaxID=290746 RepID=A0A914DS67_9BILA